MTMNGDGAKRHRWGSGGGAGGGGGGAGRRLAKGDETLATSLTVLTEAARGYGVRELFDHGPIDRQAGRVS